LIKKKINEKPRRSYEVLSKAIWAYRSAKHGAIQVTPFELVYGQEAVLPIEVILQTYRVAHQDDLTAEEYKDLMMDGIEDLPENRFNALQEIEKEKINVAKAI
jgi:hypothetical protein